MENTTTASTNKTGMYWVRDPSGQYPVLMSKAVFEARFVKPEIISEIDTLSDLTMQLEKAYGDVCGLEYVDVLLRVVEKSADKKPSFRDELHRCPIAGHTREFVDAIASLLEELVRVSAKNDEYVSKLVEQRDALERECRDLSARLENVRKAVSPQE